MNKKSRVLPISKDIDNCFVKILQYEFGDKEANDYYSKECWLENSLKDIVLTYRPSYISVNTRRQEIILIYKRDQD